MEFPIFDTLSCQYFIFHAPSQNKYIKVNEKNYKTYIQSQKQFISKRNQVNQKKV